METSLNQERMLKGAKDQSAPVDTSPTGRSQGLNLPVMQHCRTRGPPPHRMLTQGAKHM